MCHFQESRVRSQETLRLLIRQRDSEQDVWELLQRDRLLLLQSHSWLGRTPTWSRFRESPSLIGEETSSDDSPSRGTSRATGYTLRIGLLWPLLVCREISQVPHCFQMRFNLYDLEKSTNKWDPLIFNVIIIQLVVDSEQLTLKFVKSAKIITQSFNDWFSHKYSEQGNLNIC